MSVHHEPPSYFRSILKLASAEFIGAAILIGCAPVISRMYSVADFGHYELYYAFATIATAVSMLGYERSILLEYGKQEQFDALIVAATCLFVTTMLTFLCVMLVAQFRPNQEIVWIWTWAMPLFVLLAGVYNLSSIYLTRLGEFTVIARLKVASTVVAMTSQIAFAFGELGFIGLVLSNLLTQSLVAVYLFSICRSRIIAQTFQFNRRRIAELASKHWRLPVIALPGNMLAVFTNNLPVMFMARLDVELLGYFAFTRRIMGLPISALSSSIQRVYANALSNEIARTGVARKVVLKSLIYFSCAGSLLFVGLIVVGRPAIPYLFGSQWAPAVPFIVLFGLEFCNKFVFGGLSSIMYYGKLPKFDICWQLFNVSAVLLCFWIASEFQMSISWTIVAYVITSLLSYHLYGLAIIHFSNRADLLSSD